MHVEAYMDVDVCGYIHIQMCVIRRKSSCHWTTSFLGDQKQLLHCVQLPVLPAEAGLSWSC